MAVRGRAEGQGGQDQSRCWACMLGMRGLVLLRSLTTCCNRYTAQTKKAREGIPRLSGLMIPDSRFLIPRLARWMTLGGLNPRYGSADRRDLTRAAVFLWIISLPAD